MTNEQEFEVPPRDLLEAVAALGLAVTESEVETRLRYVQARAQEHGVSMSEIQRDDVAAYLRAGGRPRRARRGHNSQDGLA
jgi:hypothetical protein